MCYFLLWKLCISVFIYFFPWEIEIGVPEKRQIINVHLLSETNTLLDKMRDAGDRVTKMTANAFYALWVSRP